MTDSISVGTVRIVGAKPNAHLSGHVAKADAGAVYIGGANNTAAPGVDGADLVRYSRAGVIDLGTSISPGAILSTALHSAISIAGCSPHTQA